MLLLRLSNRLSSQLCWLQNERWLSGLRDRLLLRRVRSLRVLLGVRRVRRLSRVLRCCSGCLVGRLPRVRLRLRRLRLCRGLSLRLNRRLILRGLRLCGLRLQWLRERRQRKSGLSERRLLRLHCRLHGLHGLRRWLRRRLGRVGRLPRVLRRLVHRWHVRHECGVPSRGSRLANGNVFIGRRGQHTCSPIQI